MQRLVKQIKIIFNLFYWNKEEKQRTIYSRYRKSFGQSSRFIHENGSKQEKFLILEKDIYEQPTISIVITDEKLVSPCLEIGGKCELLQLLFNIVPLGNIKYKQETHGTASINLKILCRRKHLDTKIVSIVTESRSFVAFKQEGID